jgi:hypothetical protein
MNAVRKIKQQLYFFIYRYLYIIYIYYINRLVSAVRIFQIDVII